MSEIAVKEKLDEIANIWNDFIWDYGFCNGKIKFNEEVKTNYFADMLAYFHDTLEIVFSSKSSENFHESFSQSISLFQAIYIHQDFVEELLSIFKLNINKGDLKKDENYIVNRQIRNELIGHPIRKINGSLLSSSTLGYNDDKNIILYLRYHRKTGFKMEIITHEFSAVQKRHEAFLLFYFDNILEKLRDILIEYKFKLEHLEKVIDKGEIKSTIKVASLYYETIFQSDYIYDVDSLFQIEAKKNEHPRYEHVIKKFMADIKQEVGDKKTEILTYLNPLERLEKSPLFGPHIEVSYFLETEDNIPSKVTKKKDSYHYELGKLATKRNLEDFKFFGGLLQSKCKNNRLVLAELKHMEENIHEPIEYYSALRFIYLNLKGK